MTEYHNPYHFVPVKSKGRIHDVTWQDFLRSPGHVTHDRYCPGTFSGRIVCRLTTESPIFIGARRERDPSREMPGKVSPFTLDEKPAIPASTLRGMISSIAEAASNSALRILQEEPYSFRQTRKESLSAIGMVIIERDNGGQPILDKYHNPKCRLLPLTLPTILISSGKPVTLPTEYAGLFPEPNLKVYIGNKDSIRGADFPYETYCRDHDKFYGLALRPWSWQSFYDKREILRDECLNIKNSYLLAQKPLINDEAPRPWNEIPEKERKDYMRGILRVLGCCGRKDIPSSKKHELFIPYPEGVEKWKTFEILPEAIERFYDLADQRTEGSEDGAEWPLPYEPKGTKRNPNPADKKFRFKDGDLVYFRPASAQKIGWISLSSIWRSRVQTRSGYDGLRATAHSFFEQVDPELLPFNADRKVLTIAEQLFGFVESDKSNDNRPVLTLASRLFFSHAHIQGIKRPNSEEWLPDNKGLNDPSLPAVTLKILGNPKPPCPALYFKESNGKPKYIGKNVLEPGSRHHPQGRKFYLHHRLNHMVAGHEPWRSRFQASSVQSDLEECRFKQKTEITPLKPRAVFYFCIDFDNLSADEMGLLLYALKPTPDFRHKLGMGKPIGLGQVNIEPVGVFRVDRQERYTIAGFSGERYSQVWLAPNEDRDRWPDAYALEKRAEGDTLDKNALQEAFRVTMDKDIRQAIELLGDPKMVKARVHTPLVEGGELNDEKDTFRWFVANDTRSGSKSKESRTKADPICLEPLNSLSTRLPTLPALSEED